MFIRMYFKLITVFIHPSVIVFLDYVSMSWKMFFEITLYPGVHLVDLSLFKATFKGLPMPILIIPRDLPGLLGTIPNWVVLFLNRDVAVIATMSPPYSTANLDAAFAAFGTKVPTMRLRDIF